MNYDEINIVLAKSLVNREHTIRTRLWTHGFNMSVKACTIGKVPVLDLFISLFAFVKQLFKIDVNLYRKCIFTVLLQAFYPCIITTTQTVITSCGRHVFSSGQI